MKTPRFRNGFYDYDIFVLRIVRAICIAVVAGAFVWLAIAPLT